MGLKDLWTNLRRWHTTRAQQQQILDTVDQDGLITNADAESLSAEDVTEKTPKPESIVKKSTRLEKKESVEILSDAFNSLIGQLQQINTHLDSQITQHAELMKRIEQLPELLQTLPSVVDNQKQVVDALTEQLKAKMLKDTQFIEAVDKIPSETARQTNSILNMSQKLSVAADANVQMTESFNKFNQTLDKLDTDTVSQTDSIMQMGKTFAASDRYLKYIISKQNKRFTWIFITAISICVFAIIVLTICVLMVLKR